MEHEYRSSLLVEISVKRIIGRYGKISVSSLRGQESGQVVIAVKAVTGVSFSGFRHDRTFVGAVKQIIYGRNSCFPYAFHGIGRPDHSEILSSVEPFRVNSHYFAGIAIGEILRENESVLIVNIHGKRQHGIVVGQYIRAILKYITVHTLYILYPQRSSTSLNSASIDSERRPFSIVYFQFAIQSGIFGLPLQYRCQHDRSEIHIHAVLRFFGRLTYDIYGIFMQTHIGFMGIENRDIERMGRIGPDVEILGFVFTQIYRIVQHFVVADCTDADVGGIYRCRLRIFLLLARDALYGSL